MATHILHRAWQADLLPATAALHAIYYPMEVYGVVIHVG